MIHSTYHQLLKFLTPHGIGVVRGDQPVTQKCYVQLVRYRAQKKETLSIQTDEDPKGEEKLSYPGGSIEKDSD